MAGKRRDSKGRILRTGEVQLEDGRYRFRYTDACGDRVAIYSWKLVDTDKVPAGKRCTESLRAAEQRIENDRNDGIITAKAKKLTVNMLFDQYMELRKELKETTRCNYICMYDTHIRNEFGRRRMDELKYSDLYKLYMSLHSEHGLSVSSIQTINSILWQIFEIPVRDNVIRRNPVTGVMTDVSHKLKESPKERHPLTVEEQSALIDYIYGSRTYRKYGVLFTTLLGTGLRIGEALGLRWCDIDFKNNLITVDHALTYKTTESGGYEYHISAPKTKSGIRTIPMFADVKAALQKERRKKNNRIDPFTVDGYSGFIFLNGSGKVYTPSFIYTILQNVVADYNADETVRARKEKRDPQYLPKISAHILRHTFCTRMCENDANLKVIQDVMGHKNIRTTMNVYSEATNKAKQHSFASLEGRLKLC